MKSVEASAHPAFGPPQVVSLFRITMLPARYLMRDVPAKLNFDLDNLAVMHRKYFRVAKARFLTPTFIGNE